MKPKFSCASCNSELQWGDKFCSSCGTPIEWPAETPSSSQPRSTSSVPAQRCKVCGGENPSGAEFCQTCGAALGAGKDKKQVQAQQQRRERGTMKGTPAPATSSWKLVAGFFIFIAAGIILMQFLPGAKRPAPIQQPQTTGQPAANMQAIPQIEELEKQLAADPNNQQLLLQLANILHDNRFYEQAVRRYNEYLAKLPKDANALVDLGICYKETGKLDEARKEMEKAIQYEPKHLFAHYNLAIVYLSGGDVEKANEYFKKVIAIDPKSEVAQRAQQMLSQHNPQNLQPN